MTRPLIMMGGGGSVPADELVVELVVELGLPVLSGGSVPVVPEPVVVPVVPVIVPAPLVCVKAGCNSANAMAAIVISRTQMRGDIPPSCVGSLWHKNGWKQGKTNVTRQIGMTGSKKRRPSGAANSGRTRLQPASGAAQPGDIQAARRCPTLVRKGVRVVRRNGSTSRGRKLWLTSPDHLA